MIQMNFYKTETIYKTDYFVKLFTRQKINLRLSKGNGGREG